MYFVFVVRIIICPWRCCQIAVTSSIMIIDTYDQASLKECIEKYSSYNKLLRIFAYTCIMRFVQRIKRTNEGFTGLLTVKELRLAFLKLDEIVQNTKYKIEKASLKENKPLPPNLQNLNPFIHEFKNEVLNYYE